MYTDFKRELNNCFFGSANLGSENSVYFWSLSKGVLIFRTNDISTPRFKAKTVGRCQTIEIRWIRSISIFHFLLLGNSWDAIFVNPTHKVNEFSGHDLQRYRCSLYIIPKHTAYTHFKYILKHSFCKNVLVMNPINHNDCCLPEHNATFKG